MGRAQGSLFNGVCTSCVLKVDICGSFHRGSKKDRYSRIPLIRTPSHGLIDVLLMAPWRPEPQPIPNIDVDDVDVSPTRRLSVTSLASDITLDLIRGVPLEMCLQNFGLHFGTGQRSAVLAKTGFELSQHTNQIAAFISHDWRTSRFSKTVALLIAFNSTYAALAALLLNIMMCGLLLLDCLPGGWPTASASTYCVFYLVLCFWQRIRRCFCCRSILVFLDRLCIAQHDEDLKRRGVLGLAAFLAKSQRLVVLWSPRYFSRLWCTFEIASWLKDEEVKPVEFVPVSMAMLLWSVALLEAFLWWIFQFYVYIETDNVTLGFQGAVGVIATVLAFLLPAFLLAIPAQFYFGILHMREVLKLKSQMTSFSIREADCSCCAMRLGCWERHVQVFGIDDLAIPLDTSICSSAVSWAPRILKSYPLDWIQKDTHHWGRGIFVHPRNHMNPVTGEAIFCDRTLVFQTLRRWYTRTGDPDTHLDRLSLLLKGFESSSLLRVASECFGGGEGRVHWSQQSGSRCGLIAPSRNPKLHSATASAKHSLKVSMPWCGNS